MIPVQTPEAPRHEPAATRRWRMPWGLFAVMMVMLTGVGLMQYPDVAGWFSQYYQSQLIVDVSSELQQEDPPSLAAEVQRAHEYNDLLESGALLAPNANKPTSDAAEVSRFEYDGLLRATPTGVMGRLRIPSIDVDLPIYHGTSDATLAKGVGHLEGTSLPVGGTSQHSVLTAHRGLPEATLFNDLDKVSKGDRFTIEVFGEVLTYEVVDTRVVEPDDTDTLRAVAGEDLVTLVTCTPLGINTHRYLVTGTRVTPTPIEDIEHAGEQPNVPGFPWWAVIIGAALLLAIVLVVRAGFPRSRNSTIEE
ncbi:Sortase A, LPXTG specific [Microbacterium esteraromaticum]|uniref:Sortase A, LPXTG specific n=1 Tax=Microbacterium esteraromaticum TaxID=57043 RepID=A0A1R4K906_9MICO|nr:class C sortase [Microbacterium esteraromaticum]SJN40769.1 Sortase A, LPXTG specific [Microbacterium esteraromaticum]